MIRHSLKLAIKECALNASEEKRLLVRRALSAIAALFFDCFGHFQPMFASLSQCLLSSAVFDNLDCWRHSTNF